MRSLAAILVGIAAFFVELRRPPARPAGARPGRATCAPAPCCCKGDNDGYVEAPRLGTDVDLTVSGPDHPRPRHPDLPQPDPELGRGDLRLSAAGRRRGRHAEDGDRRPHRRRRDQGAPAGARDLRAGEGSRPARAALIEQERPNIFTNSVANIGPGETVLVQIEYQEPVRQIGRRVLAARAAGRRPALQSRSRSCRPSIFGPTRRGWGVTTTDPVPDRDRIEPPVLDPRAACAGQSGADHGAPAGRLPARRGEEPSPRGEGRGAVGRRARHQARRRPGAGRPRFRADLEARGRATRRRSACSASASAMPTICSPSSRRRPSSRPSRSRGRARRSSSSTIPARWAAPRWCRPRRASSTRSAACSRPTAST